MNGILLFCSALCTLVESTCFLKSLPGVYELDLHRDKIIMRIVRIVSIAFTLVQLTILICDIYLDVWDKLQLVILIIQLALALLSPIILYIIYPFYKRSKNK
jgi:hypothetical protein